MAGWRVGLLLLHMASLMACSSESDTVACLPDPEEPNDEASAPENLGIVEDDPTFEGEQKITISRSIHDADDEDFYRIGIRDTGISGNPKVTVLVTNGFFATAWMRCETGMLEQATCLRGAGGMDPPLDDRPSCDTEDPDNPDAAAQALFTVECAGTSDDDLDLTVRVRHPTPLDECRFYRFTVAAD